MFWTGRVIFTSILYVLFLAAYLLWLPKDFLNPASVKYVWIVGAVAVWRYSWFIYNALRGVVYRKIYFPSLRRLAKKHGKYPENVYIIVTTYRIPEDISIKVYRGAIKEIINCANHGIKATLIASVVEKSEENLVKNIWATLSPPENAELIITRFAGTGKRDGLAVAFRVLLRDAAKLPNSVVALVDGDTILTKDSILKTAELFTIDPKLGAATTDEDCILEEKNFTWKIYRLWYHLRFAQRDFTMCAVALSRKVITLTGRYSMYRGILFLDPEFVQTVQDDHIEHWRIGWLKFLTGDDKSTWFYVLKKGWDMLYVPDVMVYTKEAPPAPSFIKGATMLMLRWFGNSLRATYRAMKLSPKVTGWYVWYFIRDQRISMWTSLYGLVASVLASFKWGWSIFFAYIWWVLFTRFLIILFYALRRGYYFVSWVPLLYFNQVYGAIMKIYSLNHIYRQKWTRQKTVLAGGKESWFDRFYVVTSSNLSLLSQVLFYIIVVGYSVGTFDSSDLWKLFNIFNFLATK